MITNPTLISSSTPQPQPTSAEKSQREPKLLGIYPYCGFSRNGAVVYWVLVTAFGAAIGIYYGPKAMQKLMNNHQPATVQQVDQK